jgi:hypothetical protein
MGLLNFFKKKDRRLTPEYTFTEDDQLKATISKQQASINRRLLQAKKEELEELAMQVEQDILDQKIERAREQLGYYDEEEEEETKMDSPESLFMGLISKAMTKNQAPVSNPQTTLAPQYSEEQLREWKKQIPSAQLKHAKKLKDQELATLIKQYAPNLDETMTAKAIQIIRE